MANPEVILYHEAPTNLQFAEFHLVKRENM